MYFPELMREKVKSVNKKINKTIKQLENEKVK